MPAGFRTWTVLPHGPVERLAPNLWRVEGRLNARNLRVMVLVRLEDGRVVVHNPIALDDAGMAALEAWGEVAAVVMPNAFHRQDAFIFKERYPAARVYAPRSAVKAASRAVPCDGGWDEIPTDATLRVRHLEGVGEREGVLLVRSEDGVSAVFCDSVLNLPKLGGVLGWILHPTGMLAVPRPTAWWFASEPKALAADLERLAAEDGLVRVVPGHGGVVDTSAADRLREAGERLRG
jgi:hypothetical protein